MPKRSNFVKVIVLLIWLQITVLVLASCLDEDMAELENASVVELPSVLSSPSRSVIASSTAPSQTRTSETSSNLNQESEQTPSPSDATSTQDPFPTFDVAYSTLSNEEATKNLIALLEGNRGCELPCWWGVVPGETNLQSIESEFVPLGFDWYRDYEELVGHTAYKASVEFTSEDGVVQSIEVRGGATENTYDRNIAWKPYAIPNVLERLGPPEQVYVYRPFRFDPGGMQAYRLFLYYPDLGIEIDYLGKSSLVEANPEIARACPSIVETDEINLLLYTPGSATDYLERTLPSYTIPFVQEGENPHDAVSWEQVTDSSIEDFYYMFLNNPEGEVCFDFKTNRPVK
jgi:hypothetical protein